VSEENVEIVRRAWAFEGEALEHFDPDFVWNRLDEATAHGLDAALQSFERWKDAWEDLEGRPEEFTDAGCHVVVTSYFRGRGLRSGVEVETRIYEVYTLLNRKIVRMDEYTEREEALEAAGLRE
jgi:ketosteroid isomerase-like protein